MLVGSSTGDNQIQSDSNLKDDLFSLAEDDDIFSDSDDGAYISADESDMISFTIWTVVSHTL